jgi:hypothetical protein
LLPKFEKTSTCAAIGLGRYPPAIPAFGGLLPELAEADRNRLTAYRRYQAIGPETLALPDK